MKKPVHTSTTRRSLAKRAAWLLVIFLLAGGISWPQGATWVIDRVNNVLNTKIPHVEYPLVLGLDLQGGTRLEYLADLSKISESEKQAAMEGVRDVIERRVNALGVSEPVVQITKAGNDWRLSVELAGIRDINEAIKVIGETPTLDFREENQEVDRRLTDEEEKEMDAKNAAAKKSAEAALAKIKAGTSLEQIARAESTDPVSKEKGGDLGWLLEQSAYRGLLDTLSQVKPGTLYQTVIDGGQAYFVAQVTEEKDAGQEVRASHIIIQWAGSRESASTSTKADALARIQSIKALATSENFDAIAKQYSEEPGADETGGDLNWFAKGAMVPQFETATFAMKKGDISDVIETEYGYHIIKKTDERPLTDKRVRAVVYKQAVMTDYINTDPWVRTALTGKNLKRAQIDFDQQTGASMVSLQFDDEGAKMFAELTKKNINKNIGIFLDDQPISIPTVNQEITGGQAVITGSFTIAEAKLLAQRLQAGALPVPVSIIAQQTVGPSLGGESVAASVRAGLYGFLLVALFMIVLYRLPGLLSVVALLFYAAVVVAIFKLIPVTLTLAGIAGFILSLGIAVDANVLIFERLKEELRAGKPMSQAIDEAFKRAWLSIRDGNATTLISCAVLYWFSSSIIKGFALTLAIGVLVSMFSAIIVTRVLLKLMAHPTLVRVAPWFFLTRRPSSH